MSQPPSPTRSEAARRGPIGVLVADQHRLVRAGFRRLLEEEGDIAVVGEVARGDHAVAVARSLRPDVVVMDLAVPGLDGLHATRLILAEAELAAGVLLLAASVTDSDVVAALRAGARGVLLRDSEPRELLRAVRMIAAGGALLAPQMTRRLIAELLRERTRALSAPAQLEELTNREREIMALVAYGLSNAEVAERLSLSPATVKTHVARAVTKLGVRDRAQLAVLAYETGLVAPARPR